MKKFTLILLVALGGAFALTTNTGCSGSGTPIPQDTTNNDTTTVTIKNSFRLGLDDYEITTGDAASFAVFNTANNKTYITIVGKDENKPADEQDVTLYIDVDSNAVGTYTITNNEVELQLGVGKGVKHLEYAGISMSVNITDYDAQGGRIKGTFTGTAKAANQTSTIGLTKGKFDVLRNPDE